MRIHNGHNVYMTICYLVYIAGEVISSKDLTYWLGPDVYKLGIIATDGNHIDGPSELMIRLTNMRESPIIVNLPVSISIPEGSRPYDQLFVVS